MARVSTYAELYGWKKDVREHVPGHPVTRFLVPFKHERWRRMDELEKHFAASGWWLDGKTAIGAAIELDNARRSSLRYRLWYGDVNTGVAWPEEWDIMGYVSTSMGPMKIPILLHNQQSMGGGAILDSCIVRIDLVKTHTTRFVLSNFSTGEWAIRSVIGKALRDEGYVSEVLHNGKVHARFKDPKDALHYIQFMKGERYSK